MQHGGEVPVGVDPGFLHLTDEAQDFFRRVIEVGEEVFRPAEGGRHVHHAAEVGHPHRDGMPPAFDPGAVDVFDAAGPHVVGIVMRVDLFDRKLPLREKPDPPGGVVELRPAERRQHARAERVEVHAGIGVPGEFLCRELLVERFDQLLGGPAEIGAGCLRESGSLCPARSRMRAVNRHGHERTVERARPPPRMAVEDLGHSFLVKSDRHGEPP